MPSVRCSRVAAHRGRPARSALSSLVNKRGRHPEFSAEDEELSRTSSRQAVRALRNARQFEAEKKVEELDALLAVSREITATLDLDKVMQTIVNATAALDRSTTAARSRSCSAGAAASGPSPGMAQLDRKDPKIKTDRGAAPVGVSSPGPTSTSRRTDDGAIADRPPRDRGKVPRLLRGDGLKAFYARDPARTTRARLGVLAFESQRADRSSNDGSRDLLHILVNQATVAVRNAQLYQQVPLAGFFKPLLEKRRRLLEIPQKKRLAYGAAALARDRPRCSSSPGGSASRPRRAFFPAGGRRSTAGVDGVVDSVLHREGETVSAGRGDRER